MNRNQLKEVNSSHLTKAGENKQKLNQDYYQQNKEDINRKQREKYRTQKQSDEKVTVTNDNFSEHEPNVTVKNRQTNKGWTKEKDRDYHRKLMTEKRAQNEGLNSGSPLLERTDEDFLAAQRLITWLEELKGKEENFPRQWFSM